MESHPVRDVDERSTKERRRSQSPNTGVEEEDVYILTMQTDKHLHDRMTDLRSRYFPKRLNKLDAHLTLFHALARSKLNDIIIPHVQDVASRTQQFPINAVNPVRLGKKGIAISIPKSEGGTVAQSIHRELKRPWTKQRILSPQDAGGFKPHFTIMNKVQVESEVERAFEEVGSTFNGEWGVVEGLGLWRYAAGGWEWMQMFEFAPR